MFELDQRLQQDTVTIGSWPLCEVLLMNDAQYPWLVLVPRVAGATELYELSDEQRAQLDKESTFLSRQLMQVFEGDKMNVAALGNVVSQLHIHHVVRFRDDPAWPAPIWGKFPVQAYEQDALEKRLESLKALVASF